MVRPHSPSNAGGALWKAAENPASPAASAAAFPRAASSQHLHAPESSVTQWPANSRFSGSRVPSSEHLGAYAQNAHAQGAQALAPAPARGFEPHALAPARGFEAHEGAALFGAAARQAHAAAALPPYVPAETPAPRQPRSFFPEYYSREPLGSPLAAQQDAGWYAGAHHASEGDVTASLRLRLAQAHSQSYAGGLSGALGSPDARVSQRGVRWPVADRESLSSGPAAAPRPQRLQHMHSGSESGVSGGWPSSASAVDAASLYGGAPPEEGHARQSWRPFYEVRGRGRGPRGWRLAEGSGLTRRSYHFSPCPADPNP